MDISCQGTDYDISQLLHRAKSLLVLRRFDDVLEVCTGAFELVSKRRDDSHLSNDLFRFERNEKIYSQYQGQLRFVLNESRKCGWVFNGKIS